MGCSNCEEDKCGFVPHPCGSNAESESTELRVRLPSLPSLPSMQSLGEEGPLELRDRRSIPTITATKALMSKSPVGLLVNSVGRAALDANARPEVPKLLQPWIDSIQARVGRMGKYSKFNVFYLPLSPPPALWDYKCKRCGWWQGGTCKAVAGEISPRGWCVLWVPPSDYQPLTWPRQLVNGDW